MSHIHFVKYFDNYFFKVISFFEMQYILWIFFKSLFWEGFYKFHLPAWSSKTPPKKKKFQTFGFKGWRINKGSRDEPGCQAALQTALSPYLQPLFLTAMSFCLALCSVQLGFYMSKDLFPSDPVFQARNKYLKSCYTTRHYCILQRTLNVSLQVPKTIPA